MPRGAQVGDGGARAGAAVAGEHHGGAGRDGGVHAGRAQVVAVLEATRDERHHVAAERAERSRHQGGAAHAVHVVVAVDEDHLTGGHGGGEALHRTLQVEHGAGFVQLIQARAQEAPGSRAIGVATATEQRAYRGRESELPGQLPDDRRIRR